MSSSLLRPSVVPATVHGRALLHVELVRDLLERREFALLRLLPVLRAVLVGSVESRVGGLSETEEGRSGGG